MIAKRVPAKKNGSFSRLANYITRDNNPDLPTQTSNCDFEGYQLVLKEIEATQEMNTRSSANKSYHLVVSFPKDERPDVGQLREMEQIICDQIGLGNHQRISAVHDDTDNYHFHVAINKVNPLSFNNVEPYFDKKKLVEVCAEIEKKYQLQAVCSLDGKSGNGLSDKAAQIESHAGLQSFESYSVGQKDEIKEIFNNASSLESMNNELEKIGLVVKARGAGAVFSSLDGQFHVGASKVDRQLSKSNIEKKFGSLKVANPVNDSGFTSSKSHYEERPITKADLSSVWKSCKENLDVKKGRVKALNVEKADTYKSLKEDYQKEKLNIKHGAFVNKKGLYKLALDSYKEKMNVARSGFLDEAEKIKNEFPYHNWKSYLISEALAGSNKAIKILRDSKPESNDITVKTNCLFSRARDGKALLDGLEKTNIDKHGVVTYSSETALIKDDGEKLNVTFKDDDGLLSAIALAQEKFEGFLEINGTKEFKIKVIELTAKADLDVKFSDPEMERVRLELNKSLVGDKTQAIEEGTVDDYVSKRNESREKVQSIPLHRVFGADDQGEVEFRGKRVVKGGHVALYAKNGELLVHGLSKVQAKDLGRVKVGTKLIVSDSVIKVDEDKGRER